VFLPKCRELLPADAMWKGSVDAAFNERTRILRFQDGSYWNVLTYDMDLKAWAGQESNGVCFDEEPEGEDGYLKFEEAVGRTIDRNGTQRFTLTPVNGVGWLHDLLADADGEPRQDDEVHVVTGNIDHNPNISDEGRQRAKDIWSKRPATAEARITGRWTHREGLIFPEFIGELEVPPNSETRGGHYRHDRDLTDESRGTGSAPVDPFSGRWRVPVFESIDPGINEDHPFAFTVSFLNTPATDLFGQEDVLETFYAFKAPDLNAEQQANVVKEARLRFGYTPQFTTIDPAARNRNPETGRRLQDAWRKAGVHTVPGQNDRALTYDEIRSRLSGHRWRIWVSLKPLLGDELTKYRWRPVQGRALDAPRAEPIKRNDDLIDSLRYMVVRIPVWRGERAEDALPDGDPRRELLRRSIEHLARKRKGGKVGGAWG
jgi:hypothetical protein